jgi:hypothetical protein
VRTSSVRTPAPEESEVLEQVLVPLADLSRLAVDGSIVHGVHIGAILAAFARRLV